MSRASEKAEAFLSLLRPLQRPLEVYCRRLLRDPSHAEDALQSAVAGAFARFDRYREGTNFRAWIFRFVTHEVFNRNRKREPAFWGDSAPDVAADAPSGWPDPEEALAALVAGSDGALDHFDDPVARALRELAPYERTALLLLAVGGLSYREIHEALSIPLGSVMGYLSRARQKMRDALAGYAAERGLPPRRGAEEARP